MAAASKQLICDKYMLFVFTCAENDTSTTITYGDCKNEFTEKCGKSRDIFISYSALEGDVVYVDYGNKAEYVDWLCGAGIINAENVYEACGEYRKENFFHILNKIIVFFLSFAIILGVAVVCTLMGKAFGKKRI